MDTRVWNFGSSSWGKFPFSSKSLNLPILDSINLKKKMHRFFLQNGEKKNVSANTQITSGMDNELCIYQPHPVFIFWDWNKEIM